MKNSQNKISCEICGSKSISKREINQDNQTSGIIKFEYLKICDECHFACGFPSLSEKDLKNFYQNINRQSEKKESFFVKINKNFDHNKFLVRGLSQIQLCLMFKEFGDEKCRILDIGCGHGYSLEAASYLINNCEKFGIEASLTSKEVLEKKGIKVYQKFFEPKNIDYLSKKFDIIILSHVIEHFDCNNLFQTLFNLKEKLSEQGLILCEVPNGALDPRRNYPGKHISFFTKKSLRILFEKSGYKICFINTCGPIKKNKQKKYKIIRLGKVKNLLKRNPLTSYLLKLLKKYFNFYSKKNKGSLLNDNLLYGGDKRSFIRIVAKKL